MIRKVSAEFLGTLLFCYGATTSQGNSYTIAGSYIVGMVCTGMVSAAHFNPAITASVVLYKHLKGKLTYQKWVLYLLYVAAQFLGAFVGAGLSWLTKGTTWKMEVGPDNSMFEAFLCESVITFTICISYLMSKHFKDTKVVGFSLVAVAILAGDYSAGYISGGCYNPALGFAANFTDAMNYDVSRLHQYWIYLIAPLLGSVLAVPVHREFQLEAIAQTEKGSFRQVEIEL
jgi:aquaporin Z